MKEQEYLLNRLDDQIEWYSNKSGRNQKYFKHYKWAEMGISATIALLSLFISECPYIKYIIALLSSLIIIIVSLHGLHNFHENWIEYRKTSELLKNEKYTYLNAAGVYRDLDDSDRFILLVERCESIISHENVNWANLNSGTKGKV